MDKKKPFEIGPGYVSGPYHLEYLGIQKRLLGKCYTETPTPIVNPV